MMRFEDEPTMLTLGYELDIWNDYGLKVPITIDISPSTNSHILICGMSGSGKSYAGLGIFAKLVKLSNMAVSRNFHFADYKGEDAFNFMKSCPRYHSFKNTVEALDIVYSHLNVRLSGDEDALYPIPLFWDEYIANILALQGDDKEKKPSERIAPTIMNKVSEILLMGRSKSVRLVVMCQRPDAIAFPVGSRLNYGVVMVLGAAVRSIYEMLLPDHMAQVEGRQFGRGEGVVLLQGSELHFIKIPQYKDFEQVKQLCIQGLS